MMFVALNSEIQLLNLWDTNLPILHLEKYFYLESL